LHETDSTSVMQREVGPGISSGAYCYIAGKLAAFVPADNMNNFDSDNSTIKSDFTANRLVNLFFISTFNGKAVIRLCVKHYLVSMHWTTRNFRLIPCK